MRVELRALLVVALCAMLAGCAERPVFSHLDARNVTVSPLGAELGPDAIALVHGIAVHARVSAIDLEGKPMPVLELESTSRSVFEVKRSARLGHYLFFGVSPGRAELEVFSDGRRVGSLPVTIAMQD